jgi:hypothetical protein
MEMMHISLLTDIRRSLHLSRKELATMMGSSLRTVERMFVGKAYPSKHEYGLLIRAAYPTDPALAQRIADWLNGTLQEFGIAPPAPPPSNPSPGAPTQSVAPSPSSVSIHAVDSVLCAAADAVELPLSAVRSILTAAFVRASELGVSAEMIATALVAAKPRERPGIEDSTRG